ncbi:alpha/beta fold hydrolase [Williamsia sp. MIQD14]|uniref:alpha/beta fold hydrolase n=1 Tax=Williamsia sp. MIQD14 TaxID=3425703 RepID=UPI003DA10536
MSMPIPTLPDPVHLTVDGASVATYLLGHRRVPSTGDVVFCHGTPWSARIWADVGHAISERRRVFLWDMPGYGRSSRGEDVRLDLRTQMSRFATLLAQSDLVRPHVVAHDIGGAVALGAHLLHGADYAGLFLWDAVTLDPWGSPFFDLVRAHGDVFAQLPAALHRSLVREYIAGAAHGALGDEWLTALTHPWTGPSGQSAFYRQIASLHPAHTRSISERLADTKCAVAIGWGADDPWIPVHQAHRLRALLPGRTAPIVLDDTGHLAPVESPARVISAIEEWLDAA